VRDASVRPQSLLMRSLIAMISSQSMETHKFARDTPGPTCEPASNQRNRLASSLSIRPDSVIQRIATADKIASLDSGLAPISKLTALRNLRLHECLARGRQGRTKEDVASSGMCTWISMKRERGRPGLFKRQDLPTPSHVLNTSPDKWQVTWRVEGLPRTKLRICKEHCARDGGGSAATDCARVCAARLL